MKILDPKFKKNKSKYIIQSTLAGATLVVILSLIDSFNQAAIVAAVASTACIIFVIPNSNASMPRRVIGGHLIGIVVGTICAHILMAPILKDFIVGSNLVFNVIAAIGVGTSVLLMVMTDTEHPPAAGTALGLVIPIWSWSMPIFVLVSACLLSVIHVVLRPRLRNLL